MNRNQSAPKKKTAPKVTKTPAEVAPDATKKENQIMIDPSCTILIATKSEEFFPKRTTAWSAMLDLKSTEKRTIKAWTAVKIPVGIKTLFPKQFIGKIYARSSMFDHGLMLANWVGIIDPDYRGEIMVNYYNFGTKDVVIEKWAAIAQLSFELNAIRIVSEDKIYRWENTEVKGIFSEDLFSDFEAKFPTTRWDGWFGSTNKPE